MNKTVCYIKYCIGLMMVFSPLFHAKAQVTYVANINSASVKQYIDGFGASTAWHGQISVAEADAAFKNTNDSQLGLSILRIRIDPNSQWLDEKMNAQKAKDQGVKVLATPWTPPASMKTNNNVIHGSLKATSYADYATYLNNFCDYMIDYQYRKLVDVISLQNEPDWDATYECCLWNATQLMNFCKNYASTIKIPIMMPESLNFRASLSDSTLNDSVAASHISYIGGHLYGSTPQNYAKAINKGKRVWMTEHYYDGDSIDVCLVVAKEILDCMYNNMNAYIWWWLKLPTSNIINTGGTIKKKGYAIAQFSKYVRPGYYRIDATYQPQSGVFVVAFKGAKNVIVVVNQNTSKKVQTFTFQNDTVQGVFRYTTSGSKNIKNDKDILCSGNSFIDTLDAQSITTFVSGCVPAPVRAYLEVNDGVLNAANKINVKSGDSVKFAPTADYEGSWSWSGCGTSGSSNMQTIHPTDSCQSIVTFTNTCGAITTTAYTVTLRSNVGINSSVVNNDIKVYPNPTKNGSFKITVPDHLIGSKIDITNTLGKQVYHHTITNQVMDINTGLTPGIYFLTIFEKGACFSVKVVVE